MAKESYYTIDDSNFARKIVKSVFDKLGYDYVGEANSYKDALLGLKDVRESERKLDIITLDITMPEITGDELIPVILKYFPNVKIIMTTSVANKEMVQKCIASGAKGYILKPLTEEKVLEAMNIITINSLIKKKVTK